MKKIILLPLYYVISATLLPFVISLFMSPKPPTSVGEEAVSEKTVSVFNHITQTDSIMDEDEYLTGVVAAEMPASFEIEALKAQAVAARTYTIYKSQSTDHVQDVCTDPNHCQAYFTKEDMMANWGADYDFYLERITTAVKETTGEHLTYNDEPIMAVFHSMGGGRTENSADVWGGDVPYLVSVESPGEEEGTNYYSTKSVTFEEFKNTILSNYPTSVISSFSDISEPVLTQGGHVKSMIIGGVSVTGTKIRSMFDLRSTKFDISFSEPNVIFTVTGYGHGVGMSQYGANAMAKEGKNYKEILSHYYQGTTLIE
ncbi:MAG: stage II sporulation protein D [Clostridia bacterium]